MNYEMEKWRVRLDFFMLCVWLVLGVALAAISLVYYGVDFRGYYAAALVLVDGGNPYDYDQVARVLLEVTGTMGNNPFYYPPWFAWIFLPLVALPFEWARIIWMAVNVVIWNVGLLRLHKALHWSMEGWRLYSLFALATFSFAWITWRYEQAGVLLFAILVETILAIQAGRHIKAGVWLALLLIKPNLTLIIAVGLAVWLIRNGRQRAVLVALIALLVLLVVSTSITPNWYEPFSRDGFGAGLTTVLDGPDEVVAYRINSTFPDWLGIFGIRRQVRFALYGIVLIACLIWFAIVVWKSTSLLHAISVGVLVSFAVTPYALQYDFPPLVIPFFWSIWVASSTSTGRRVAILLAGFILSVILWQQNISWAYWMVVGLILLFFWAERVQVRRRLLSEKSTAKSKNS